MSISAVEASSDRGSADSNTADDMQMLRTGLELARASQLTMVRLQLALHRSHRRTAMQALDNLLEIDAEMEGLAATLDDAPAHPVRDTALFGFIGFQKEAIAAEKHVLTSGRSRFDAEPATAPTLAEDHANEADLPAPSNHPDGAEEGHDRAGARRWIYVAALAVAIAAIGCGLTAYFWPALSVAMASF